MRHRNRVECGGAASEATYNAKWTEPLESSGAKLKFSSFSAGSCSLAFEKKGRVCVSKWVLFQNLTNLVIFASALHDEKWYLAVQGSAPTFNKYCYVRRSPMKFWRVYEVTVEEWSRGAVTVVDSSPFACCFFLTMVGTGPILPPKSSGFDNNNFTFQGVATECSLQCAQLPDSRKLL